MQRVLYYGNEKFFALALSEIMKSSKIEFIATSDFGEFTPFVADWRPDIAVIEANDLGDDVCSHLEKYGTPFVVVGTPEQRDSVDIYSSKWRAYYEKPVIVGEVITKLKTWCVQ